MNNVMITKTVRAGSNEPLEVAYILPKYDESLTLEQTICSSTSAKHASLVNTKGAKKLRFFSHEEEVDGKEVTVIDAAIYGLA